MVEPPAQSTKMTDAHFEESDDRCWTRVKLRPGRFGIGFGDGMTEILWRWGTFLLNAVFKFNNNQTMRPGNY